MTRRRLIFHQPSLRLKGRDYAEAGAYFVTLVTWQRDCVFGSICRGNACVASTGQSIGDVVRLNEFGEIARRCWMDILDHFPFVELDAFVIMPNHVHGVVVIDGKSLEATHVVDPTPVDPTQALGLHRGPKRGSVAAIVGSYKSAVSRRVNALRGVTGVPVWQTNYYEHIVRNERALKRIRRYILDNPARWAADEENPERVRQNPMRNAE